MSNQTEILFTEELNKEFFEYHKKNPKVWERFKAKTFEAIKKGFKNYGSKGIFEQLRWDMAGSVNSDGFKVNNIFTPMYARYFEKQYPQHEGFFRKRKTTRTV